MSAVTPGSWIARGDGDRFIVVEAVNPLSHKERQQMTHLIAAAPELLESMRSIRVFAHDCIENGPDRGQLGNLFAIRDEADKCIAKAEGRS